MRGQCWDQELSGSLPEEVSRGHSASERSEPSGSLPRLKAAQLADAMFQAVHDRGLVARSQVPTNLTELAALMGDPKLSSPDLPLGKAISAFEAHLHAVLQVRGASPLSWLG